MIIAPTPFCRYALPKMPPCKHISVAMRSIGLSTAIRRTAKKRSIEKNALALSMILPEVNDSTAGFSMHIILASCMALAVISTLVDSSSIVVWISNKLLPDDEDDIGPSQTRLKEGVDDSSSKLSKRKIRNPITNRLIDVEGPTFRDLDRRGLLSPLAYSETSYGTNQSENVFQYEEIRPGEGVIPDDGSVVLIRFEARIGGPKGPIVASTPPDSKPFVFEVGDRTIWRGLDGAVRRMREGAIVTLVLPPGWGYTRRRSHPEPDPGRGRALVDALLLARETGEGGGNGGAGGEDDSDVPMHVQVRLEAVLAMPPALLLTAAAAGGVVPPERLRRMLREAPDGRLELAAEEPEAESQ